MALPDWLKENWFSLAQCVGIVGGLLFTGLSLRRDTKARRASDMLALSEHHRDLWGEAHRRPELRRIMEAEVDFVAAPITFFEEQFLFVVITHFQTGWHLARSGSLLSLEVLSEDAGWFFNLPIPRTVWSATKGGRDSKFVRFIEEAQSRHSSMADSPKKNGWWKRGLFAAQSSKP